MTAIRPTSRAAYEHLVESGQLKGQLVEIQRLIVDVGPGTAAEICKGTKWGRNLNLTRARFVELQAKGLIVEVGQRQCSETGKLALVWEATTRTKALHIDRKSRGGAKMWRKISTELAPYTEHRKGCNAQALTSDTCTCGLATIAKRMLQAEGESR